MNGLHSLEYKMSDHIWIPLDHEDQYNWSNSYYQNDPPQSINILSEPMFSNINLDFNIRHNRFPEREKPENSTGDGLEIFEVLFERSEPISEEIEIASSPISHSQQPSVSQNTINQAPQTTQVIFSPDALFVHGKTEKGDRFQTKNLCKYLHTETTNFLKKRAVIYQLNKQEVQQVKGFCQGGVSIESFKGLFKNNKINNLCKNYYESKYFIQEILTSKMEMKTKIVFLKYLEKIRSLTYDNEFKSWKKESKDLF